MRTLSAARSQRRAFRRRRSRLTLGAAAAVLLLALSAAHPTAGAQTEEDEEVPVAPESRAEIEVVSVTRYDQYTELLIELDNPTDGSIGPPLQLHDPAAVEVPGETRNDLSGLRLLDSDAGVAYAPYRNLDEQFCTCLRVQIPFDQGDSWSGWWRAEPLPDDVDAVDVLDPGGRELATDVPVTDGTDGPSSLSAGDDPANAVDPDDLVAGRVLDLAAGTTVIQDEEPVIDATEDVLSLRADVLFEFGESSLTPEAERVLDDAVSRIEDLQPSRLSVTGHTDNIGDPDFNQGLSEDRANAVDQALSDRLGAAAPATEVSGSGETEPVAPNENEDGSDNPHGRAMNRRVEIEVIE